MDYIGDFRLAAVFDHKFTTRSFTTGIPTTLSGSPVVSVYKDNGTTQVTTGVTLTTDFDGVTGLNNVHIDTADAFYAAGSNFDVVLTAGTVGGVSVVGETIFSFSIEGRSHLMSTVAGRTLGVSAAGKASVDLGVALPDSIPADGVAPSPEQALYMLVQYLLERSVSGNTVVVKKPNGSTTLFTLTLDSASAPTNITRTS